MNAELIQELLRPFLAGEELSARQLEQVGAYLALLVKWNAKTNLTAVRQPEEMVTRHFGESFFAARMMFGREIQQPHPKPTEGLGWGTHEVKSAIDLGSGAGFPGLPMAIYAPQMRVTLIESQNKKATFLKEVVRALELKNVLVFGGRGEDHKSKASLVTLRAVEKFEQAARVATGLVESGGRLGLMIGVAQEKSLPDGFEWEVGKPIPQSPGKVVIVGKKK